MPDFSSIIPETHQNISFGYIEVLIQDRRQELFSGVMRISYPSGENFVFMFLEGVQLKLYHCAEASAEIVNRQSWSQILNHPNASVGQLPLDVEGLRLVRVIHEAPILNKEQTEYSYKELVEQAGIWAADRDPGFVHISSKGSDRIYVLAGYPASVVEELSVVAGQPRFSIVDDAFPETLPDTDYKISRYHSSVGNDIWREYKLRLAFNPLMKLLIARFGELAGRALADRLSGNLTNWSINGGWNLNISSNGVINRQYFDSFDDSIQAYRGILRQFQDEAKPAIGPRLVENMIRESLAKLDPGFRDILTQYIYRQFEAGDAALSQKERT